MMKQIIQKLGMLAAMLLASLSASAYDFEADGIYYNITSMANLEVEVTYSTLYYDNKSPYIGEVTIPQTVNYNNRTFTVASIGKSAFGGTHGNYYGDYGQGCSVTTVNLPPSITTISDYAFARCESLVSVTPLEHIKYIGKYAFAKTPLSTVSLIGIEEISEYAFYCCEQLKSVILGKNLKSIGDYAFKKCSSLLEVFYTGAVRPKQSSSSYNDTNQFLEKYVPSYSIYGFGREYLSFSKNSYDYNGQSHHIEWNNNLKAYKCEIAESECITDVNAGQYTKYIKATYSNGVDFSVDIPYEYTINKVPMTLTVNNAQREYGEPNPAFTCNISGFVNGEKEQTLGITPSFECEATNMSDVGDYRILASIYAPNYEITYNYGTLTVVKAPLAATVLDASRIYGNENPDFSLSFSGLKNGESAPEWSSIPKYSTTADVFSDVGQYTVNASDGAADNYEITYYPGTLTVTKRNLTAKANDCERQYKEANPVFGISYIGFVYNDSEESLTKKPVAQCQATPSSDVGAYSIVLSGGEDDNYHFVYQDGTLNITPFTITGFKDTYYAVEYYDMALSSSESYFNYIPEIVGSYSEDDFLIEKWFLDQDNKYDDHVATISSGIYAGSYVSTNVDSPMWAGRYIFNLKPKTPNVTAISPRAYLTVNPTSNNLEWYKESPIIIKVGETVDLEINYLADVWCTFDTDFDKEIITLSSEDETGNNPHWYATGLKEGETTLYFNILCDKNDLGFFNFTASEPQYKRIIVKSSSGIEEVQNDYDSTSVVARDESIYILNKDAKSIVRVFSIQGNLIAETTDDVIGNLEKGLYIVSVGLKSYKVII